MSNEPDPDVLSMARLRAGDDLALNEIMDRWQRRLISFLVRVTGNEAAAVDLAEETFVRVYQSRARYRPTGAFSTWLFAIATNLARHHIRWKQRHPSLPIDAPTDDQNSLLETLSASDPVPRKRLEDDEKANAVRNAILELPAELREALIFFEYEDLSHREIAKLQRCSPKAVETRLYRARGILRKKLARWLSDS
ncbi:MAG TPA: sigma-70 family RNA polymerase sigma factor [Terrimicrobiaceae bacterium]